MGCAYYYPSTKKHQIVNERVVQDYIEVPAEELSESALLGLITEFVLREGTDYGLEEFSLAQKLDSIRKQLRQGAVKIIYSFAQESCTIVTTDELKSGLSRKR